MPFVAGCFYEICTAHSMTDNIGEYWMGFVWLAAVRAIKQNPPVHQSQTPVVLMAMK